MWIFKPRFLPFVSGFLLTATLVVPVARGIGVLLGLYTVQEVKPHVFVWVPDDVIDQDCDPLFVRPATAGFIVTSAGVVVVDTTNSPMHARDLLYEIRRRTDLPVRYVINTSSAGDHFLGNEVFVDEEATLISTKEAQEEMIDYREDVAARMSAEQGWKLQARMRGFHITPSTQTFDDKMTLNMGDQVIRICSVLHSGISSENAVVYLPSAKTLFLGELYDNQYFPRIGSRDVHEWIEVLRQMEGWDVDTYVPGHGAPGTKRDLAEFRKFLEWLVAQVDMRLKQGQTPAQVVKTLWLPRTYKWHAPDLAEDTVADVCRQLAPQHGTPALSQPGGQ
jgi:cyclase